ncbi:hypothetical protein [Novosphingobium sp. FKTRR1]|uniref:hypothetical protein n=1 Tax=unclassified Novosphingobium TaxID=2644732 RepID=UPI001CF00680|nr:hypothetical protein [Novosphingobium sp. FKTRR1]
MADSDSEPPANPVTRARIEVEAQIPPERRGPGWDRHWRELEHYAAEAMDWTVQSPPPSPKKKRQN